MTKKDEAAKEHVSTYGRLDYLSQMNLFNQRVEDFKSGWTQHGEELMKMATAKSYHTMNSRGHETFHAPFVLLSDLEAIIKELEK